MKFRKKPVVIEAFELGEDPMPDWFMDAVTRDEVILHSREGELLGAEIVTLEGVHTARAQTRDRHGDFIIRGIQGELYPCKPEIFDATYEPVDSVREAANNGSGWAIKSPDGNIIATTFHQNRAPLWAIDQIPYLHPDEIRIVEHYIANECGGVWKSIGVADEGGLVRSAKALGYHVVRAIIAECADGTQREEEAKK